MNKVREPTTELWKVELTNYKNRKEKLRMFKKILVGLVVVGAVVGMGALTCFADEPDAVSGATAETITDSDISSEISNYMSDNEESKGLLNDNEENKGLLNDSYIKTDPDSGVSYADYNDWWNYHPDEILSFANTVEESDWDNKELIDSDEMRIIDAHALYQVGTINSTELHRLMENDFQYKEYEIPTGWIIYGNDVYERWLFATEDDALTYLNTHTINSDYRLYAYWKTYLRDYQDEYIKYVEAYDDDEPIIEEPIDEPIIDDTIIDEPEEEPTEDDVIVQTDELTGIHFVNYSDYVGGEKEVVNFLSTIEQGEPIEDDPVIDEPEDDDPVIDEPQEDEDEDTDDNEHDNTEVELGGHSIPAIQCATFFNTEIKAQCTDVEDGIVKVICGSTVNYATFKDGKMINRFRTTKTPKNIVKTIEVGTPITTLRLE